MAKQPFDGEIKALLRFLRGQRRHVFDALEGLDEAALRRAVLPSGWHSVSLVSHLAIDDERFWFRAIVAGEQDVVAEVLGGADDGWKQGADMSPEEAFELYRREAELADAIITDCDPDAPPAWWPEGWFGGWRVDTVREVVLHVIAETAAHAGHLDAVRELIDGQQWMVLD